MRKINLFILFLFTASLKSFLGVDTLNPGSDDLTANTLILLELKIGLESFWRTKFFMQKGPFYPFFFY